MIEDVEEHEANRLLKAGMMYSPRMRHLMTPQDSVQVGAMVLEAHEFTVHDGAGGEAAEHFQLRVAAPVISQLPPPKTPAGCFHCSQGTHAVPLHLEHIGARIKGQG